MKESVIPSLSRRNFLKRAAASAGAGAVFTIAGTKSSGSILGANDTVRIGVAGIYGRGQVHMVQFARMPGVKVTYLIDPDASLHGNRAKKIQELGGNTPACVQDIRKALEDKNLDAISIASCNHWHALMTIWACQAGKDVSVEKPQSNNIWEGRQAVKAARKYNRIVQIGTAHEHASGKMETFRKQSDHYEVVGIAEPDPELRKRHENHPAYRGVPWMTEDQLLNGACEAGITENFLGGTRRSEPAIPP